MNRRLRSCRLRPRCPPSPRCRRPHRPDRLCSSTMTSMRARVSTPRTEVRVVHVELVVHVPSEHQRYLAKRTRSKGSRPFQFLRARPWLYLTPMRLPGNCLEIVVVILGLGVSSIAHADAVPPPPKSCPKGHVGVTDHGGPKCVLAAPKNCAPGYRGALGGTCVLATCSSDDQCDDGRRCLLVETCQEFRELHWTGWGWGAQRPMQRDNLFGGPPRPRPDGPAKKAWVSLNICGQDGPCKAPAECRPVAHCYPPSAVGKTKAKIVTSDGSGTPPAPSGDTSEFATPPPDAVETAGGGGAGNDVANQPRGVNPDKDAPASDSEGGCRKGCSVTSTPSLVGWVGLPLLACLGLLRRRRRVGSR
jgi:MYXO-CTERM domain-containing protein